MIKLYSTGCPVCKTIEKLLNDYKIEYEVISEKETILNFADKAGVLNAPILELENGEILADDIKQMVEWIKSN